jgi:nitroreductase
MSPRLMGNAGSARRKMRERYRAAPDFEFGWTATLDVLLSHRSVRAYLPNRLPDGTLETLVAAAQSAASSSNLQAWSVLAVEDPARKARLAALVGGQKHVEQAPLFLVWLVDQNRAGQIAAGRGEPVAALDYFESFLLGAVDAALAAQNAAVAAESLGLGAELGLPRKVFAVFGLVVGYPDPAVPTGVKPRLPQEAVLFRERYGWGKAQTAAVAAYDPRMRAFQRDQGMAEQDWTEQAGKRLRDAQALNGRDVLRAAIEQLGFELK